MPAPQPKRILQPYRCPSCGGTNVQWAEYILSHRPILGTDGSKLYVSSEYTDNGDCSTDEHLFCQDCGWELHENQVDIAWPELEHGWDNEVVQKEGA